MFSLGFRVVRTDENPIRVNVDIPLYCETSAANVALFLTIEEIGHDQMCPRTIA
jgi:hypothetical protein